MYHVAGTGSTAIIIYIISYFFYRNGFFSLQFHRRFWNIILAVTFILTALAGVFMALQINYKWNIPFIKTIIKWHVEFGVGMTFAGIFHFLWHFSYFTRIYKRQDTIPSTCDIQLLNPKDISLSLFLTGFCSSSIQLLLIREIMNISGGYELIAGIFLGSWLIGSAIGASLAGRSAMNDIKRISLIFSFAPFISIFLLILLSRMFLGPGETPSLLTGIIFTLLVLLPFCITSGFAFVKLIKCAREINSFIPGKSFSIETTGGVVAGIFISIMTSGLQNTYQILLTINILYIAFVLLTFYVKSRIKNLLIRILVTSLITCIIIFNPDIFFRQQLLPGIRVTGSKDSPYGNITTGEYGGEKSLYYNQRLLSYNDDVTEREENIHYAMLQIANPENVLLLSGSLSSHFSEIMKYPVKRVIYVERDPVLAFEEKILIPDKDTSKLTIVHDDALRFMKKTSDKFDVVIVLLPPPSTLLLNRYYTTEFYKIVKSKLKPKGIFMCSPGPGNNYFNEESVNLYSSVFNSMTPYFKNVKPVNGNKLFFIASDADLSLSFSQLTDIRKIKTIYVNSDFLNDDLINKKSDEVLSLMNPEIKRNSSAFPIACFHFQSYSFSRNLDEKIPAIVFIILLFALPSLFIKRRSMFMYFSAASLAGFEIIVLLILQITFGSMYQLSGLIIAGLMGGLAAGSGMNLKFLNRFTLRFIAILLMIFYVLTGSLFNYINLINHEIPEVILIIILAFLPAFMTGHIFRRLTLGKEGETLLSETYSADLAGSALGFIFISGFIVPLFGIKVSIYMLSLLIFTGFMLGTVKNKS